MKIKVYCDGETMILVRGDRTAEAEAIMAAVDGIAPEDVQTAEWDTEKSGVLIMNFKFEGGSDGPGA